jgi:hypothetical protein
MRAERGDGQGMLVHTGDELIAVYAPLRVACTRSGHALHDAIRDARKADRSGSEIGAMLLRAG